ncbi:MULTISPECIES: SusD/RagB family nutrient-binding outer membrane lipoprotein [Arenibacter]|uniref:SusD/RagB family nutrient-binding outer membrane lipoprotein n=1 Tax=Arenibacter TaxID=178469 RepID=UPI0004DF5784|nr:MULTISPECIES: SusD/RagB family nutrient-binding outer membrane lipoprotein [Arenibacter]GBF17891.1 starch-binding associating with outer membrane [Arenibacter sp. NBRC 103722]|eukprot:TRINITY_DN1580_c0_g1_i4.p1 TRINITY_DN1580_c0_g1~~TRINITY_DN1580_c0_g1_i4.p1  ORF type:complete len:565 (-),score=139.16 TRINITY_DN1580_c0_g1_i4:7903-9597(-)
MSKINKIFKLFLVVCLLSATSCDNELTEINQNPNGVDPSQGNPSFLLTQVMVNTALDVGSKGYSGELSAFVQYTQKDSWGNNNYDWDGSGWNTYYGNLRSAKLALQRSQELGYTLHEAIAQILMAQNFVTLADYYGDVPYSNAVQADEDVILPTYDSQEAVYKGAIADFVAAAASISNNMGNLEAFGASQDIFFGGDAEKWMKYANSLALRYYMRLSEKDPSYAQAGVTATLAKPLISSVDEECALAYIGTSDGTAQPSNSSTGGASAFNRVKPCTTFTDRLRELNDPRANIWFAPVAIPIKVVAAADVPGGEDDVVVDGVRYINEETLADNGLKIYDKNTWKADRLAGLSLVDTSSTYVGLPVSYQGSEPYTYNLNPNPVQGGGNVHVSLMNDQFKEASGDFLKARVLSYAEVCFLKAEAALKGWGTDAEGNYNKGVQASLDTWGIGDEYADYIDNAEVAFDGTLAQIMEQKWIANFATASEAYLDWRRTGLPDLQTGPFALSSVIPVRFQYPDEERNINEANYNAALSSLETTSHTNDVPGKYENDTPWSKPWILQGVSKPW